MNKHSKGNRHYGQNLWPADRKLPDNAAPGRAINVPENNLLYRQWSSTVSMVY